MSSRWTACWLFILPLMALGCTQYEYELVRPDRLARHIDNQAQTTFKIAPLNYGMISKENRLVVVIQNPLAEPVQILGDRSEVVDPSGQSHPLRSQTIAPTAFVKLILPPLRPRFRRRHRPVSTFCAQGRLDLPASARRPARPSAPCRPPPWRRPRPTPGPSTWTIFQTAIHTTGTLTAKARFA